MQESPSQLGVQETPQETGGHIPVETEAASKLCLESGESVGIDIAVATAAAAALQDGFVTAPESSGITEQSVQPDNGSPPPVTQHAAPHPQIGMAAMEDTSVKLGVLASIDIAAEQTSGLQQDALVPSFPSGGIQTDSLSNEQEQPKNDGKLTDDLKKPHDFTSESSVAPNCAPESNLSNPPTVTTALPALQNDTKLVDQNDDDSKEATTAPFPYTHLLVDSEFSDAKYQGLVPDSFFVAMTQFTYCGLSQDDRVGKYKRRELGFSGLCCKRCNGQPGFGRYFPGSLDSFLNGKNSKGIVRHIAVECRAVPPEIRETVLKLEREEERTPYQSRYGSRKKFFVSIWNKLRAKKFHADDSQDILEVGKGDNGDTDLSNRTDEGASADANSISWEDLLKDSPIVNIGDRHLVPDTILAALAQMRPCELTEEDRVGRCKSHEVGFLGLCCKHCDGKAGKPGYGRYFPSSLRSLSQVDSCQHIVKHVTLKCEKCPPEVRSIVLELQLLENTDRVRYGSRKMFFRRVWARLHGDAALDRTVLDDSAREPGGGSSGSGTRGAASEDGLKPEAGDDDTESSIPWNIICSSESLVKEEDRGLISNSQFAALAQMQPCKIQIEDQAGWYKNRPVGFGGFRCRHCGGRPSYGRYFPNTVRSFAQTTSSQTVIAHVTNHCKVCPKEIVQAVTQLQQLDNSKPNLKLSWAGTYGDRKVFYDRVWSRFHCLPDSKRANEGDDNTNNNGVLPEDSSGGDTTDKVDVSTNVVPIAGKRTKQDLRREQDADKRRRLMIEQSEKTVEGTVEKEPSIVIQKDVASEEASAAAKDLMVLI